MKKILKIGGWAGVCSLILSTQLFANEIQTKNVLEDLKPNKIFIDGDLIKVENEDVRNQIIKYIKDDILIKNPKIVMEAVAKEKNTDINIDACTSCHGYNFDKQAL